MFSEERRSRILGLLNERGKVSSAELVVELGVSEDTVRRDLRELAQSGLLKKVHGGALAVSEVPFEYSARRILNVESKRAIARRAAGLVSSNAVVFIDGGTTTGLIAEFLPPNLRATFVTHSPANAVSLSACKNIEVVLLGGKIVSELLITTGPEVFETIGSIRADLTLCSVQGLTLEDGATVSHLEDAQIKRSYLAHSAETAVLAGSDKIGFAVQYMVAEIKELDYLVTDADDRQVAEIERQGVTVIRP